MTEVGEWPSIPAVTVSAGERFGDQLAVADGDTTLRGRTLAAHVDDGVVHVLVTGIDPFADDLSPRDETAADDKDHFENPEDYDFSFAHFTDTQYIAEGAAGVLGQVRRDGEEQQCGPCAGQLAIDGE